MSNVNSATTELYTITHPMMGDWSDPATIAEISADVAMNWRDENIKYRVEVKWNKVVIYGMDYESNSRDWCEWLDLGAGEYSLEIGERYEPADPEDDEYASDEAYLGESTLTKVRRQKGLLLEDRPQSPETPIQEGFEVVYGGWANGAGGIDNPRVVVFADRASFEAQNPNWEAMIEDAKHRQCTPYTNLGNIYLFDRPQGGYEIYPRDGRTRADGSVAEIW